MGDFFKIKRFKILLVVLVLLAFMLQAAWTGGFSPAISQAAGVVVTPLQKLSSSISGAVSGYFRRYVRADEIAAENEALRAEIDELRRQAVNYEEYKHENEELRNAINEKFPGVFRSDGSLNRRKLGEEVFARKDRMEQLNEIVFRFLVPEIERRVEALPEHPCGSRRWLVLRVGMDFKLRCEGCGHELMLPRSKAEKSIKRVLRTEEPQA